MILKDGKFWDDKGNVVPIEHGNKEQIALMIEAMTPKPKELDSIDLNRLRKECKAYIDFVSSPEYHEDEDREYEHAIYESAMETFYGEKVWDYINDKLK